MVADYFLIDSEYFQEAAVRVSFAREMVRALENNLSQVSLPTALFLTCSVHPSPNLFSPTKYIAF